MRNVALYKHRALSVLLRDIKKTHCCSLKMYSIIIRVEDLLRYMGNKQLCKAKSNPF